MGNPVQPGKPAFNGGKITAKQAIKYFNDLDAQITAVSDLATAKAAMHKIRKGMKKMALMLWQQLED